MRLSVKANDYTVKRKNRELISRSSKISEEAVEIRTNPQMQSIWGFANLVEPNHCRFCSGIAILEIHTVTNRISIPILARSVLCRFLCRGYAVPDGVYLPRQFLRFHGAA